MPLRVEADGKSLAHCVDSMLHPFAAGELLIDANDLRIRYGRPEPHTQGCRVFFEGDLPGGLFVRSHVAPDRRVIEIPGIACSEVRLVQRKAEVTVMPGHEWAAGYACITPAVCDFLAHAGQHVIHAACLSLGSQPGGPAVLVAGQSGLGKSTTAMALLRQGYRLLGDDACFILTGPDGQVAVWGLPRPCKVHARTLSLLPWLTDYRRRPAVTPEEFFIDLHDLAGEGSHALHKPVLVLLLERRNDREHQIRPADAVDALARLTRENVRAQDTRAAGSAGKAFRLLGRLLSECPAYHLSVGPALAGVGECIAAKIVGPADLLNRLQRGDS